MDPPLAHEVCPRYTLAIGSTEIKNLAALRRREDWPLWEPAVRAEIDHAVKVKGALTYRTSREMRAARLAYGDVFEILHLVTPCVIKHGADGTMARRKFRITAADARSRVGSKFAAETYSGAIDGSTVRFLTKITLGRGGVLRFLDVKGAYFEGTKVLPGEPGGRSIWAPVPEGWDVFGYYARAADGSRNWFEVTGNVPGLWDAGRVWAADNDDFLLGEGFVQSVVDRRVFIKQLSSTPGEKLFIVGVYVDDYWTYCEDDASYEAFFQRWSARYTALASMSCASHDFCGNTYTQHDDGSISLGCGNLMASMDLLLEPHGLAPDVYETPMVADALTHLRERTPVRLEPVGRPNPGGSCHPWSGFVHRARDSH